MDESEQVTIEFDDEQFEALRGFVAGHPSRVEILASARRQRHVWLVRADHVSLQWLAQDITHSLVHGDARDDADALESAASSIEHVLGLD